MRNPNINQESFFILSTSGYIPKTEKVADPFDNQKSRINAHKAESYLKHLESERGKSQMAIVFDIFRAHPEGITDKEIYQITGIFPSTVSARRNDINNSTDPAYNIYKIAPVRDKDGKPLKRNGGLINCLKSKYGL